MRLICGFSPNPPGHGARYKEELTLESAKAVLLELVQKEAPGQKVRAQHQPAAFSPSHCSCMS